MAFVDPADTGENRLACRHGSLTTDEMLVPLVALGGDDCDRRQPAGDDPGPRRRGAPLRPEVVDAPGAAERPPAPRDADGPEADQGAPGESIEQPAKLLRIGSMVKQLLEEVR